MIFSQRKDQAVLVVDLGSGTAPVSVSELKEWARIARDDEDQTIGLLVAAATSAVEAATGLALSRRQFRLVVEKRPRDGVIGAAKRPVVSVDAVVGTGFDGAEIDFDPAVDAEISADGSAIKLSSSVWAASPNGVQATVTAGLLPDEVPAGARHAILVAAASWLETRTAVDSGARPVLPNAELRLVRSLKTVRI
ncbi:hypothetical protein FP2506_11267 [Fulvimarina pelagi HTCC2506]|uniref:Uncharacterized protein n=1 Tax=Fulvimarina pelagi HTCC2506 TaxID=314231 RepID=Q0FZ26_9HYPH|nr:hypothetical protein FP2506_11267 [Fulvimarina pelagi HTCC2506]